MKTKPKAQLITLGQKLDRAIAALSVVRDETVELHPTSSKMKHAPKKFSEIRERFQKHPYGGIRAVVEFPNGYGASIIQTSFSYGSELGLYEIGILKDGSLTYSSGITDDVIPRCDEKKVLSIVRKVASLKK